MWRNQIMAMREKSDCLPKILHVINSFATNRLYVHLIGLLGTHKVPQIIYSAVRTEKEARYRPDELGNIPIFSHLILKRPDVLFFRRKIRKIRDDILSHIDLTDIELVHAHTLYSDGAVGLKLKQEYGIPYIVAVRAGDVTAFARLRPDLAAIRNQVLREAQTVVFLSPTLHQQLNRHLDSQLQDVVSRKAVTIPNGIDPFYLENPPLSESADDDATLKILYIGKLIEQKNLISLVKAANLLSRNRNVKLTIAGSGEMGPKIDKMTASGEYPFLNRLGEIREKETLVKLYRSHDVFVMVPKQETFGLVYIEALSQGLPVVFAANEGIAGYLEGKHFAEPVTDITDIREIADAIKHIAQRKNKQLSEEGVRFARKFDWNEIILQYLELYRKTC